MKIICNRQPLLDALKSVERATAAKDVNPVLGGILLDTTSNMLRITGYDLELGISTTMDAEIGEPGKIVMPAKLIIEAMRRISDDKVEISSDKGDKVKIKGAHTNYSVSGISAADFPSLPVVDGTQQFNIKQSVLKDMIDNTVFAVATGTTHPVHTGCKFDYAGGSLTVVAVDGYRLALRHEEVSIDADNMSLVVPGKSLLELSKLLKDDDSDVKVSVSTQHITFEFNGYSVVTRLLKGEFLDYKKAIPNGSKTSVRVNVSELMDAVDRVSLLISDNVKSPVLMSIESGIIKLSCLTPTGSAFDELQCRQDGGSIEVGFNSRYMHDALKACGEDEIILQFNGPLSPIKLLPIDGDRFTFLVLPVRINKQEGL